MNASTTTTGNGTTTIIFGIIAGLLVFAVLTGRKVPLLTSERAVLVAVTLLGMAMCSYGFGRVAAAGDTSHPLAILGYLVGAVMLVIAVAGIFGWALPFVPNARQAILLVGVLGGVKIVLSLVHRTLFM